MRTKKIHRTRIQQVRRDDIVNAAVAVINRVGYAGSSINAIATEAGVGKSTVMYHFTSKEELLHTIIKLVYKDGWEFMKPRIDATDTIKDKLREYILSNIEFIALNSEKIAAVHKVVIGSAPLEFDDNSVSSLTKFFVEGQQAGEFCEFDPYIMALSLRFVIDSSSFYLQEHPGVDAKSYALEIYQLFERSTINNGGQ